MPARKPSRSANRKRKKPKEVWGTFLLVSKYLGSKKDEEDAYQFRQNPDGTFAIRIDLGAEGLSSLVVRPVRCSLRDLMTKKRLLIKQATEIANDPRSLDLRP